MSTVPGAASLAVRDVLTGPPRTGHVVAVFATCAYVDLAGRLVAVEVPGALRLPCSVVLTLPSLDGVASGVPASAGGGRLRLGDLDVAVARWWAPARPRDHRPRGEDVAATSGWDAFVLGLLGLGPGLTPAGDDLLAGLLVGLAGRPDLRDPLAAAVDRHAAARTTWLSAALLRHAADGHAVPAVVAVADALAGHGADDALATALPRLLAVGHTSGAALARGLLLAAQTIATRPTDRQEAA